MVRRLFSVPRLVALTGLAILIYLGLSSPLGAQAPAFTQGYGADQVLQKGMIVRLDPNDPEKVQALSQKEIEDMYGIVVNANDAPVTLSSEGQKVFVATAGSYEALVSSQNGDIKAGDYVTISTLNGVGMRSGDKEALVIGRALGEFNDKSETLSNATIKDSAGKERTVRLGRTAIDITIARNPLLRVDRPNLPEFLQEASQSIAGKPVDAPRVYLALVIFIITTAIAGSLLYGGVRSGIISIGRNPLSKKMVIRGMAQVVISGLIIFIVGLFGVYLLLRL